MFVGSLKVVGYRFTATVSAIFHRQRGKDNKKCELFSLVLNSPALGLSWMFYIYCVCVVYFPIKVTPVIVSHYCLCW